MLTRLRNTTGLTYNGYRPNAVIDVEDAEVLLQDGRSKIGEVEEAKELNLDKMKKSELITYAESLGLKVSRDDTNEEIRNAILAYEEN